MRRAGIILIIIQVIAYSSKTSGADIDDSFAYKLGYNAFGIVGVILLLISIFTSKNKPKQPMV